MAPDTDRDLIEQLGGATKVAQRLGCSVQRVQNWKERGIPPLVRLQHPDVFPLPQPITSTPTESQPQ